MGLGLHSSRTQSGAAAMVGARLSERLAAAQADDGRFASWYDYWHAWGNLQAYALATSPFTTRGEMRAKLHADNFLPQYVRQRPAASRCSGSNAAGQYFSFQSCDSLVEIFPQIAYGQRPFVWSAAAVYTQQNREIKYLKLVQELTSWFSGNNVAGVAMYESSNGQGLRRHYLGHKG